LTFQAAAHLHACSAVMAVRTASTVSHQWCIEPSHRLAATACLRRRPIRPTGFTCAPSVGQQPRLARALGSHRGRHRQPGASPPPPQRLPCASPRPEAARHAPPVEQRRAPQRARPAGGQIACRSGGVVAHGDERRQDVGAHLARLIANRVANTGPVGRWADRRRSWARGRTRPTACRSRGWSARRSSPVSGLAERILHRRAHDPTATAQETCYYLLRLSWSDMNWRRASSGEAAQATHDQS
jgi:hypothetical protein